MTMNNNLIHHENGSIVTDQELIQEIQDKFCIDVEKATHLLEIYRDSLTDRELCNCIEEGFSPVPMEAL